MDRGIATEDHEQWLREHRFRYLVVSRERTRHFDTEAVQRIQNVPGHDVHLHNVLPEDSQSVRLYCCSEQRATKERGIVEARDLADATPFLLFVSCAACTVEQRDHCLRSQVPEWRTPGAATDEPTLSNYILSFLLSKTPPQGRKPSIAP